MIHRNILYFGHQVVVACDAQCDKAWGINNRPCIRFDAFNPDDYAYLADGELGEAPEDPCTYEGGEGKPTAYGDGCDHRLNKWCVRECERSTVADTLDDVSLPDFSVRKSNMPFKHPSPATGDDDG